MCHNERRGVSGYIVLGMHRSGTSCLTGLLETSGLRVGSVPRYCRDNKKGNIENPLVNLCNDRILRRSGGSWDRPPKQILLEKNCPVDMGDILQTLKRHEPWAMKDPRLLLTLEAWLPYLPTFQLVGTFRHPIAVARSLSRRHQWPIQKGLDLWLHYNRRLIHFHIEHGFPMVRFDLAGDAYLRQYNGLCNELGLPFDRQAAGRFYDERLITTTCTSRAKMSKSVSETYAYLVSRADIFGKNC